MNNWVVYKHVTPSGKVYIGISHNVKKRWESNGKHYKGCPHFWNAILKYGWNNIEHQVLYECLTHEEACEKEKELISYYKELGISYNLSDGGEGNVLYGELNPFYGKHHSEDTKRKISEKNTGKVNYWKGKHLSEKTRKKISESRIGTKNWMYGKKMLPQTKEALIKSTKGIPKSEEQKAKISNSLKGRKHSQEQNEKMRKFMLENNPFKGMKHSDEAKAKMSASKKGKVSWYKEKGPHAYFQYCDLGQIPICQNTCIDFGANWSSVRRAIDKQNNSNFECVIKYKREKYEKNCKSVKTQ